MSSRWTRVGPISGVSVALLLTLAGGASAVAGVDASVSVDPSATLSHSGKFGLHWILDTSAPNAEYPAVTCAYTVGGTLDKLTIRQPVIFATDHGSGEDHQTVGWKAVIQYQDPAAAGSAPAAIIWQAYHETSTSKARASDKYPADLLPKTYDLPANAGQHWVYRVIYHLMWYAANGRRVIGRAAHSPEWYLVKYLGAASPTSESCGGQLELGVVAAVPPYGTGPHSGPFGRHWILDSASEPPEYTAVSCEYNAAGKLRKIRIRRPIVFAADRGPGLDSQLVGWRASIQVAATDADSQDWQSLGSTSVTKARASDRAWGDLLPKTFTVPPSQPSFYVFRVVYRLYWYGSDGTTIKGRASHWPWWYLVVDHDGTKSIGQEECFADRAV